METLVSGAELGRMLGVSRQAVSAARKAGRLQVASRNARGHPVYDLATARRQFQPDIMQTIRCVPGGRPKKDCIHPCEVDDINHDGPVDAIVAAAVEARGWLVTASPAEIEHRRSATLARMGELAARHRRYRDRTGQWPTPWPSWREYSILEIQLMELEGIRSDEVPDG